MRGVSKKKLTFMDNPKYYASLPVEKAILKLGCSTTALKIWEREAGIERVDPRKAKAQEAKDRMAEEIEEWTDDGKSKHSLKQLSKKYNISTATVLSFLNDNEIMPKHQATQTKLGTKWKDAQPYMSRAVKRVCRRMGGWGRPKGIDAHLEYLSDQRE